MIQIPGDGLNLATTIFLNVPTVQQLLVHPIQAPSLATTPPNFNPNYAVYQRSDIIYLIIFYNEDFGILAGDTVQQCISKFHRFLTTY
jgi:hypothetical protein